MSLKSVLTALADAIRSKSGLSGAMTLEQMIEAVNEIQQGGIDTSDATAVASDLLAGKTAYVSTGEKVTGTIETVTQATPSISVNSSGKITASATQSAGYVNSGTKSATKQLTTQSAQSITPSTSDIKISSGQYLTGDQTIKGDANLLPENIKSGVSIFGVDGAFAASNYGKYAWAKYEVLNYEITKTSLGGTKPTDMAYTRYADYSITDDGRFVLSRSTSVYGYHYISGQSSNAKSIYAESFTLNGTAYSLWTLSNERIDDTKGRKLGYVVSDGSSDYPEDGVQDGYWYVKIT